MAIGRRASQPGGQGLAVAGSLLWRGTGVAGGGQRGERCRSQLCLPCGVQVSERRKPGGVSRGCLAGCAEGGRDGGAVCGAADAAQRGDSGVLD